MTPKAPSGEEIADVFQARFGVGLKQGIKRIEELAGEAIFFDTWLRKGDGGEWDNPLGLPMEVRSRVRMEDRDFAILAFFAGVGRLALLEQVAAEALPAAPADGHPRLPPGSGET
jgi:hypothetical protein